MTIDKAEVGPADQLPSGPNLNQGQNYFYVALHPSWVFVSDPVSPVALPVTQATLTTCEGTIPGISAPASSFAIDGAWYFPLHGTIS